MKTSSIIVVALLAAATASLLPAHSAIAQAPCSTSRIMADSAREEVMTVLGNDGTLAKEIRQEQGIGKPTDQSIRVIKDGLICSKLATQFGHPIGAHTTFVVLAIGPVFYAREPDQQKGTGILTDSTFKVIARMGVSLPGGQAVGAKNP